MKSKPIFIATTLVAALSLSSCAGIYPMGQPLGQCNGSPVSITVDNDKPRATGAITDDVIRLTVTGDLNDISIEYRSGVYGDLGLRTVNQQFLGPTPVPEPVPTSDAEAFLDFFDYITLGEGPSGTKGSGAKIPITNDLIRFNSSGATHTLDLYFIDILFGETFGDDLEFIVFTLMPGAFLVKCTATGEFVAAAPVFPNLTELDGDPAFTLEDNFEVTGTTSRLVLPESYVGYEAFIAAMERTSSSPLSANPATDRWLQLYSSTEESLIVAQYATVGPGGLVDPTAWSGAGDFEKDATYNLLVLLFDPSSYADFQTVIFDMKVSPQGTGEFREFTGVFTPPLGEETSPTLPPLGPVQTDTASPVISNPSSPIQISTRGLRVHTVRGALLQRVTSVFLAAPEIEGQILSSNATQLQVKFPKMKPGTYDLRLKHPGGVLVQSDFIRYYKSSKLEQLKVGLDSKKANWSTLLDSALARNTGTVQINCVALVPAGSSAAAVRKKATAICSSVADDSVGKRVVVKQVSATAAPSVVLKLWD
jgi:hypothetical protein